MKTLFSTLLIFLIIFHSPLPSVERKDKKNSLRYGPDGALFLDPYIFPHLKNLKGQRILDAGCSKNPYGIYAAQNGAYVHAIDIEPRIIENAAEAVKEAEVQNYVELEIGDVSEINYPDQFFNLVLSINVGSYLPVTTEIYTINDQIRMTGLGPHCKEMARVLKHDSLAILAAPTSYGVVFTNGSDQKKMFAHIKEILEKIGTGEDITVIKNHLGTLAEVNRATFVCRNKGLSLVTDESELEEGELVWRKVPGHVVHHRYHPEKEYQKALLEAGFTIQRIDRPRFQNEQERLLYNQGRDEHEKLGEEYRYHHPFIIFVLKKTGSS
ncbi:MAG: class I SAM-dependent methyltransferase [Waddliaceae bacterium]